KPHIVWVWIGFVILAIGTLICLIPQFVVDWLSGPPRPSKLGRAGELGVMVLLVGGALAGLASTAHAAGPPAEHVQSGMGMGADSTGYAAMNRPSNDTEDRAMKELICICGCPRQNVFDCPCSTAAQLRRQVTEYLGQTDNHGKPLFDLSTASGRETAY